MTLFSRTSAGVMRPLLGCSLALNLAFVVHLSFVADEDGETDETGIEENVSGEANPTELVAARMDTGTNGALGDEARGQNTESASADPVSVSEGWTVTEASVSHSLSRTFTNAVGEDGPALSAVFARLFVWDVNLNRDLLAGDRVEVLWRKDDEGMVEIAAARLDSGRHGRTFAAYRWHLPGDAYPSYWWEDGTEAALQLQDSPLNVYEQITSLLRDRPDHGGMDFKVDTGTDVVSPFAGTVTRTNWHWRGNGNCVEVRYDDGVMAKFLHLSEVQVEVGQRVAAGETVALSGNTGRSTAPHLHYQVERGGHVIDPVDYHGTSRRQLSSAAMQRFTVEMTRLQGVLDAELASR